MRQIAIVVFAFLCITVAHAQKGSGVEFGFAFDAGVPVGNDLQSVTSAGFGGDATLGYNLDTKFALLVRGGFMTFLTKDQYRSYNINSIGDGFLKVVGRYTFYNRYFLEPQAGYVNFSSVKGGINKINSDGLAYGIGIGAFLNRTKSFDLSLRYEGATCQNGIDFVGLRFGYSIKPGTHF